MSVSGAAQFYVWDEGLVAAATLSERGGACWLLAYEVGSGRVRPVTTGGVRCVAPEGHAVPMVTVTLSGGAEVTCTADTPFLTAAGPVAAEDLAVGTALLPTSLAMEALSAGQAAFLDAGAGRQVAAVAALEERPALYAVAVEGYLLCTAAVAIGGLQEGT